MREIVTQIVEAELVVGAVGNVGSVGLALLRRRLAAPDHANAQAQELVDRTHPARVALGEILVDRDDMHALAGQRIQIGRQRRDQGLALTGSHLGDLALVQRHTAHHLHVEVPQAEGPPGGLADQCKGLGQQRLQARTVGKLLAQRVGAGTQRIVVLRLEVCFQRIDPGDQLAVALDQPLVAAAEKPGQEFGQNGGTPIANTAGGRPGRTTKPAILRFHRCFWGRMTPDTRSGAVPLSRPGGYDAPDPPGARGARPRNAGSDP